MIYSHFDIFWHFFYHWILIRSSVSVEQCRSPDAMVLFTVMDHDVLTANDFAGEAFLGLSTIPGVTDTNASIDNFHGLKHTELPLMHQKNRSENRFYPFHFYLLSWSLRIERGEIKILHKTILSNYVVETVKGFCKNLLLNWSQFW